MKPDGPKKGRNATQRKSGQGHHPPENSDRVEMFLGGLIFIIKHHGAPKEVVDSFSEQVKTYLTVDREETFLKRAKYLILAPMAQYLKNELPSPPDLVFKPEGLWKKWSSPRLSVYNHKNTHLWYSFLQGKRGADPVTQNIVLSNFVKHRGQMEAPDPVELDEASEEVKDEIMDLLEPLLELLSIQIFDDLKHFFLHPEEEVHKASESASLDKPRSKGGQAADLREIMRRSDDDLREEARLHKLSTCPSIVEYEHVVRPNQMWKDLERPQELDDLKDDLLDYIRTFETPLTLEAKVEAVLEPLKVRTISKGPGKAYYLGKRVQKAIHSRMRVLPAFKLIGQPACPTDLVDLVRNHHKIRPLSDQERWLSIDYSSATDGLSAALSAEILERLLVRLAPLNMCLYYLLKSVLAPHLIHYPTLTVTGDDGKAKKVTLPSVQQRNGQLMGSILSFPILCLANFGLYCLVRTRGYKKALPLGVALKTVLINGDDCIYIGNEGEWEDHKSYGAMIGLAMSPGKAYIHPRYANINSCCIDYPLLPKKSQVDFEKAIEELEEELEILNSIGEEYLPDYPMTFWSDEDIALYSKIMEDSNRVCKRVSEIEFTISELKRIGPTPGHPRVIPYLNVGLLRGNHKVLGEVGGGLSRKDRETCKTPLITVMNRVIEGSLPGKEADVFRQYVHRHSKEISKEARGRNLFLPVSLGGFGVHPVPGITIRYTAGQLSLADKLISKSQYLRPFTRPMPKGREIPSVEDGFYDPIREQPEISGIPVRIPKIASQMATRRPELLQVEWGLYQTCLQAGSA